jgi:limonene-1,2-epoxide hydrolase
MITDLQADAMEDEVSIETLLKKAKLVAATRFNRKAGELTMDLDILRTAAGLRILTGRVDEVIATR